MGFSSTIQIVDLNYFLIKKWSVIVIIELNEWIQLVRLNCKTKESRRSVIDVENALDAFNAVDFAFVALLITAMFEPLRANGTLKLWSHSTLVT